MNWKSTTAFSGVTLLAAWLGQPPKTPPAATSDADSRVSRPVANDIQAQANRLQVRVRREMDYRDPTRNPFRFTERRAVPAPRADRVVAPPAALAPPAAPRLPFELSGMASDGGDAPRTAILTTPSDVVFVTQGDHVAGYTVTRVDETGIEVTAADGSVRRLTLTP